MDTFTIRRLEKILDGYIEQKVPGNVRSSVRLSYTWESNRLTLLEERPDARYGKWISLAIVQFRLEQGKWRVLAHNGDQQWVDVSAIAPHADFERQLEQVEMDPEGVFWIS